MPTKSIFAINQIATKFGGTQSPLLVVETTVYKTFVSVSLGESGHPHLLWRLLYIKHLFQ